MTAPVVPPAAVRDRVARFGRDHRAVAPGALTEVVVTGSAVLGDWWPTVSDIDLVMVMARPVTATEWTALRALHATPGPPHVDGLYLTEDQLAAGPDLVRTAPQVIDGALDQDQVGGQLTWVTWREVEQGAAATVTDDGVGPWSPSTRRFPEADREVRGASRRNLQEYWGPLGVRSRAQLAVRPPDAAVDAGTMQWIALGPARLVVTIERGTVVSKSAAAAFAAERWPGHADLLRRVAAARAGGDAVFTVADAADALDLLEQCVLRALDPA